MFLTVLLLFITSILIIVYLWFKNTFNYWSNHKQIPSGKASIFSGDLKDFVTFKTNFGYHLKTIYEDPKFKDEAVVGIYSLAQPALLIREPELIKSIFIKDFDSFCNRFAANDPHRDPIGGLSLFFARYGYWKEMRSKISPIFSSVKMKQMYPLIQNVGKNLEKFLNKKDDKFVVEMKDLAASFATDVIATTIYGLNSNSLENPKEQFNLEARKLAVFNLKRALNILIVFFAPKWNNILRTKIFFKETDKFLRSTVKYVIKDRENTKVKRNDLIDVFVKLKQEAEEQGENMTKYMDGLTAQAAIFLIGGFETTSTTISNILFEIAKDSKIQERLRNEIVQALQEDNDEISYESISNMEYMNMIIDETLRLYPVFPFLEREYAKPRDKSTHFSLKPYYDYALPDGMPVFISAYALNYDPKYWTNPTKFDPERFSLENKKSINPMVYLPFGNGPHNCVGGRLGLLQVKTCLVYFLKNHCVKICSQTNMQPEFDPKAVILQTKGGIYLEVVKDDLYDKIKNNKKFNKIYY